MKIRYFALVWVASFFLVVGCTTPPPAPAQALAPIAPSTTQCENRWSDMVPHVGPGWRVVDLTPAQAKHFVAGVNKTPPETEYEADEVHVTQKQGEPNAYAYFIVEGCVAHVIQVPMALLEGLIAGPGVSL